MCELLLTKIHVLVRSYGRTGNRQEAGRGIDREAVRLDIRLDCFDSLYAGRSHSPTTWVNTLREPHASPLRFTHTMGATCTCTRLASSVVGWLSLESNRIVNSEGLAFIRSGRERYTHIIDMFPTRTCT